MVEFWLALWENLRTYLGVITAISAAVIVLAIIFGSMELDVWGENHSRGQVGANLRRKAFKWLPLPVVLGVFLCIPSVKDMWEMRIALVKWHLASPENVAASVDTIKRIGHELECKYLTCEEKK